MVELTLINLWPFSDLGYLDNRHPAGECEIHEILTTANLGDVEQLVISVKWLGRKVIRLHYARICPLLESPSNLMTIFTARNLSCFKVMFLHLSVILFPPPRWPLKRQTVRILLECILVIFSAHQPSAKDNDFQSCLSVQKGNPCTGP